MPTWIRLASASRATGSEMASRSRLKAACGLKDGKSDRAVKFYFVQLRRLTHLNSTLNRHTPSLHAHPTNNLIRPALLKVGMLMSQQHTGRDAVPFSHDAGPHGDLRFVHEAGEAGTSTYCSEFFGFGADEKAGL
jgi:hypothetical protein